MMQSLCHVFMVFSLWIVHSESLECCPYVYNNETGSCYQMFPDKIIWTEAMKRCKSLGAKLAVILTESDRTFLQGRGADGWVGANDIQQEGAYTDTYGLTIPTNELNWRSDQPDGDSIDEDCIRLNNRLEAVDESCDRKFKYTCEWSVQKVHGSHHIIFRDKSDTVLCDRGIMKSVIVSNVVQCGFACMKEVECLGVLYPSHPSLGETNNCTLYKYQLGDNVDFTAVPTISVYDIKKMPWKSYYTHTTN